MSENGQYFLSSLSDFYPMFSLSDLRETKVYQEALEEGREEGEEKGRKEGKEEKARQIALKMLSAGFSISEIAQFTDLSPATIEQLPRQQHN